MHLYPRRACHCVHPKREESIGHRATCELISSSKYFLDSSHDRGPSPKGMNHVSMYCCLLLSYALVFSDVVLCDIVSTVGVKAWIVNNRYLERILYDRCVWFFGI